MSRLHLDDDSLKMVRETLCVVASGVAEHAREHRDRLQRMIDEIDRQRPLGPDGKHGNRHTPTCGCTDIPQEETGNPWVTLISRLNSAMDTYQNLAEQALERRDFSQIEKFAWLADGFRSALSFAIEGAETAGETEAVKSATEQA